MMPPGQAPEPSWPRAPAVGDLVVTVAALVVAAVLAMVRGPSGPPETVRVEVEGKLVRQLPIDTTATVEVEGPRGRTTIRVEPGRARVLEAPCPHRLCVRRGWIDAAGEVAVCVPNALVLRLQGGGRRFDGVTQ